MCNGGIQLNVTPPLAQPGAKQLTVWRVSGVKPMQINLNALHAQPAQMSCTHKHSHVTANTYNLPFLTDRDTCVFLCVYSHFAHLVFSYHTAIVLLAPARLFNFLFLRVDACVTFPAGAHTLMLSTASHPGCKNTARSLGVSCMEKKSPSLLSHTPLCMNPKKGTVNELRGGLRSWCSKPNFRKCVWNVQWDVNTSAFKSFAKYFVMSHIWSTLSMNLHHKCVQYSGQFRQPFSSDLTVIILSNWFHAFWTHRLACCMLHKQSAHSFS